MSKRICGYMAVTTSAFARAVTVGLVALCMGAGCAYTRDRARDLCDVVTLSGEDHKYGCNALIIVPIGLDFSHGSGFGLRDGYAGKYHYSENVLTFGYAALWQAEFRPDADLRGKGYASSTMTRTDPPDKPWRYCGTVGAAVGLHYGVRVGLNIVELTDFILGWTTLDILNDDEIHTPQPEMTLM